MASKDKAWLEYYVELLEDLNIQAFDQNDLKNAFDAGYDEGFKCACQPRQPETITSLLNCNVCGHSDSEHRLHDTGLITCNLCPSGECRQPQVRDFTDNAAR